MSTSEVNRSQPMPRDSGGGTVINGPAQFNQSHFGSGDINIGSDTEAKTRHAKGPVTGPGDGATIGLVTALGEEFAAMRALIDDMAPAPVLGDRTSYETGTLPSRDPATSHRVVLTVLPEGGNDTAATACTNLHRSFPLIRYVVMVGIAAGVPSPYQPAEHVRLGDIFVGSWGIVDYDHLDVRPDGVYLRDGFPQPSPVLKAAAKRLAADALLDNRPWEAWLDLTHRSELWRFARPDASTDILRTGDESGQILPHPDEVLSEHPPGMPKVHEGRIGSADISLSDARVRDALARDHGIRAFEMEGKGIGKAGFLNGLDWFVVRGISDYAESRRDGTWRRYASLVAAAYTRALLATVDPVLPGRQSGQE